MIFYIAKPKNPSDTSNLITSLHSIGINANHLPEGDISIKCADIDLALRAKILCEEYYASFKLSMPI
jgi:hypothetical protein